MNAGFPIGLAAAAGVLAAVNPCGFAMLPSFVAAYLGVDQDERSSPVTRRVLEGLAVGGSVTAGFMVVFAAIGVVVSFGSTFVAREFPTIVFVLGVLLLGAGVWLASGRSLPITVPTPGRATARRGIAGAFLYGGLYGLASLGCTLPVFLVVVGSSFTAGSVASGVGLFLIYSAGMGVVVTGVAVATALLRSALARGLRRALPYVQRASGGLLCAAGAYITLRELNQPRIGRDAWLRALSERSGAVAVGVIVAASAAGLLLSAVGSRRRAMAKVAR